MRLNKRHRMLYGRRASAHVLFNIESIKVETGKMVDSAGREMSNSYYSESGSLDNEELG